jgi:hypothetical protein
MSPVGICVMIMAMMVMVAINSLDAYLGVDIIPKKEE